MDPFSIGLVGLFLIALLLALRVPLAFVMTAVPASGIWLVQASDAGAGAGGGVAAAATIFAAFFDLFHSYDLAMVPLFVALANIAFYSGITTRIYDAAAVWLRTLPGGAAIAAVMGCGGFAAISGSSVGCASTMGRICVPEMLRLGYDPRLAASSVAVGGTLGALIPPSILFILFGIFSDTPVAKLFMAGLLPGLLSLAGMVGVILWWVAQEPDAAPAAAPGGASRAEAALAAWPALLLFVVIMGGIPSGALTATEAAAVCVILSVAIGFAQRRLSLDVLWRAIRESLVQTSAIFLIAGAAKLFLAFLAATQMNTAVVDWITRSDLSFLAVIALIVVAYLILGMFLDPVCILVLTLPFMLPVVQLYQMDAIWFGVIVVKLLEIGMITPPVGLNVFVIGNVARDVGINRIFSGVARFLAVDLLVLLVLILFPILSTLIPSLM